MSSTANQETNFIPAISRAFWEKIAAQNRSTSPAATIEKLRSHTYKVADLIFLFPLVWVAVCIAIVQYCQAQPFPFLSTFATAILYASSLTIPAVYQFLSPATPILLYFWTAIYLRKILAASISIPFQLVTFTHPFLAFFLWLFGPNHAIQFHARLVGYTNLAVLALFVLPLTTLYARASTAPTTSQLGYQGAFAGLNTGLHMFTLAHFFPQYKSAGILFGILCIWLGLSRDFFGFVLGFCAATSFFYFIPEELLGANAALQSAPIAVDNSNEKDPEAQPFILSAEGGSNLGMASAFYHAIVILTASKQFMKNPPHPCKHLKVKQHKFLKSNSKYRNGNPLM